MITYHSLYLEKQTRFIVFLILLLFLPNLTHSESNIPLIPKLDVGFPLPYYSPVTGTFAEIRNHNLHLGSDFKSYGLNGHSILATFDGYVDEISYSKTGYGLSLNFYNSQYKIKSKYAHLHSFGGGITDLEYLRQALFLMGEKEGFSLKLPPGLFPSKKGRVLGKTGESGSGISHLHLEFRTEKGTINPLYFPDLHQKDETPPTILSLLIESESLDKPLLLMAKEIKSGVYQLIDEDGIDIKIISLSGKVRIRISGYDIIRSRNKNNVYGMDLFLNKKKIFSRNFDFLSYEEGSKKHQFYDVNRSSFSPPVYFYHLYDQSKNWKEEGYSTDLTLFPINSIHEFEAGLSDATGNRSYTKFVIGNDILTNPSSVKKIAVERKVYSLDKMLSLNTSKNESNGNGYIKIEDIENSSLLPFSIPKGLVLKSKVYRISTRNYSWKGDAEGQLMQSPPPTSKEALYFWDDSTKKFASINHRKKANLIAFSLSKLGYIMILEDLSPPYVTPMTSLARHIEIPEIRAECFENRYYALNDIGTGYKSSVELLIDGQIFPYEYDPDRASIKISLPKSLYKEKPYLLVEVRAFDFAGNDSEPYLDLISTNGWKKEYYASCPLIE